MAAVRGVFKRARIKVASCFINLCRKQRIALRLLLARIKMKRSLSARFYTFPVRPCEVEGRTIASIKERMNNKHGEFEQHLRNWLMAHDGQRLDPVEICPGVKLVGCTRNLSVVHELIRDGRFGHELGGGIQALIPTDELAVSDHEFRVLYGDGDWYALYSIAKRGHRQLACLAFELNGVVTEDTKAEMWRVLGLAEKLSRELLASI